MNLNNKPEKSPYATHSLEYIRAINKTAAKKPAEKSQRSGDLRAKEQNSEWKKKI